MPSVRTPSWRAGWRLALIAWGVWCLLLGALPTVAWSQVAPAAPAVYLTDTHQAQDVPPHQLWVDDTGKFTLAQVMALPKDRFRPANPDTVYGLGNTRNLWIRLTFVRDADSRKDWRLSFPLPLLDSVTVFQQSEAGQWRPQTSGDTIANSHWPEGGRYPFFRLEVPPGQTRDVYVCVHHVTPVSVPVRVTSETVHDERLQVEYFGLGIIFGAMLLLIVACIAQSLVYREPTYGWYAVYAGLMTLAVAAYTGVAGHLIWRDADSWADSAQGCLALLASGAALLFVCHLCGIAARFARFERFARGVGVLSLVAGVVFVWVPRETLGIWLLITVMPLTFVVAMVTALLTAVRGDQVGRWVLAAFVPMALFAALALLRVMGLLLANWVTQYGVIVAMALEVPLLLVALSIRLRERHGAETRAYALSTQDALTGLLAEHLYRDRLRQVVSRARRDKESAAVVLVDLVNHASIRRAHGAAVAEQSLLRAVIKLRRVLRDVDTTSRVGEARFGLILEGVSSRRGVTARAAQLIASGLMPLKGLKPDVTLHFHVAAVLLGERVEEAYDLMEHLSQLLGEMSPRTRRPIRFLEPELTRPMGLEGDSVDPNPSSLFENSRWQEP